MIDLADKDDMVQETFFPILEENNVIPVITEDEDDDLAESRVGEVIELPTGDIFPNPLQPRKTFEQSALNELANSISEHGVIMPIVVNRTKNGKYMIIAGERRWRASCLAGKATVPAIIREYNDKEIKEVSLIENLQREDLNPVEAALAMRRLMEEYGMTQEDLAVRLGKSRSTVANTLRLLQLSPAVIAMVSDGRLSAGHARALISLPDSEQLTTATKVVKNGLSVREVEQLVKDYFNPPEQIKRQKREKMIQQSLELRDLIDRMQRVLGTRVRAIGNDNKGRIYIDYYMKDDLDRIAEIIEKVEKTSR